jgi:hypothetical protein
MQESSLTAVGIEPATFDFGLLVNQMTWAMFTQIALRIDVKEHIGGIIVTERCCFAQLLKVVHSVSEK